MIYILYGLVILGILVFIHEMGHFLTAKACKIPVEAFSIGFGKPIFTKKIGETEYRLSPIPFGGYVKMVGETPDDTREGGFNSHPVWHRALVAFSGPAFNILSAIILLALVASMGIRRYDHIQDTTVGFVHEESPAKEMILPGDSLVAINETPVDSWDEINQIFARMKDSYTVYFIREGEKKKTSFAVPLPETGSFEHLGSGLYPKKNAVIGNIVPNGAADASDELFPKDTILRINDTPVHHSAQVILTLEEYTPKQGPVSLTLSGPKGTRTVNITPRYTEEDERYLLGIEFEPAPYETVTYSFPRALGHGLEQTQKIVKTMFYFLSPGRFLSTIQYSSGPVGIMQISGAAVRSGIQDTFRLMAFLSINLGIINLLPLAITDGGILVFLAYEAVRGRPLSLKKQEFIQRIFAAVLISFFIFITIRDILNFSALQNMLH
ncbi:MAG: RIP metalloprotease RseP [Fibrobacterota bacterium]